MLRLQHQVLLINQLHYRNYFFNLFNFSAKHAEDDKKFNRKTKKPDFHYDQRRINQRIRLNNKNAKVQRRRRNNYNS